MSERDEKAQEVMRQAVRASLDSIRQEGAARLEEMLVTVDVQKTLDMHVSAQAVYRRLVDWRHQQGATD